MTPQEVKIFEDWWMFMSEQGFTSEIIAESNVSVSFLSTEDYSYEEGDAIGFDQLTEDAKTRILAKYGPISSMRERLRNEGYSEYQDLEESQF